MNLLTRIVYPQSDGEPMAESTIQYDWIALLKWNLETLFDARPDVFVAGDNFVYPVEGNPKIRLAPDVYVAFGRPKGDRSSYRVWQEGNIFPQVIIEVLSPSNRPAEMQAKREFYERHGAEEYYVLEPHGEMFLEGWRRSADKLELIPQDDIVDFVSPLLGIHFITRDGTVTVYGPDGKFWKTPSGMAKISQALTDKAEARADEANERADRAIAEAEAERRKAEAAIGKARLLATKLRELGLDPDSLG